MNLESEFLFFLLNQFIDAQSWSETREFLEDNPELLSQEADDILAEWIEMYQDDPSAVDVLQHHRRIIQDCRERGIDIAFAAIAASQSRPDAPAELYDLIQQISPSQRNTMDTPRWIELHRQALALLPRFANPPLWAALQIELANSLAQDPHGPRADNLEQAIHHAQQALLEYTRQDFPEHWAGIQVNLASAYIDRIYADRANNLEQAIDHCQRALEVYTREAFPQQWATTQNSMAIAFVDRIHGDRAENLEQAIHHYQQALEVRTRQASPEWWAETHNNLGTAHARRVRGERAENLEQAIYHSQQALLVYTQEAFPEAWAMTQHNLANNYWNRIRGDRAENLEQAIHHYQGALEVYTRQAFPEKWATTQNNMANAYRQRIRGEQAENIEQAIHHYQQALEVRTRQALPEQWAGTQNNLSFAYLDRIRGDRAENLEQAIQHGKQALEVYTRQALPEQWAMTQNNLANACWIRIRGDRAENLEQAIHHYQGALEVSTRQAFPTEWAMIQNNLANAFKDRLRGQPAENLEQAIYHFQQALEVRSLDHLPADHQQTQRSLGDLYFEARKWQGALAAYQAAIQAGKLLLDAAYTESGRQAEVGKTAWLYAQTAYCLWQLDQPQEALRRLEQGKTRLLAEALSLGETNLAQLPLEQQHSLRQARQAIADLEGEMRQPTDAPGRRGDRELASALHQARAGLRRQLAAIQQTHPDFLPTGLDVPAILALIPPGGALVAPFVTSHGGAAFVIPHGTGAVTNDHLLPLPSLTTAFLSELLLGPADGPQVSGWLGAYDRFLQGSNQAAQARWFSQIEAVTGQLWTSLMGPIHQRLGALDLAPGAAVLLMPQGGLGLLPLHAAWQPENGVTHAFLDDYTVTYAPSAYALRISQRRARQPARQARSLCAAVNPTQDLLYTPLEGEAVANLFPPDRQTILSEIEATAGAFSTAVQGQAYVHYSGHGFYHWRDPGQSGLDLADKTLTLNAILTGLDLGACRLVTLSACETGITDVRQSPDEYVGLPAGFLQAGAPGIISTLWAVNDLSTMLLMEHFYQLHLQEGMEIAAALRGAQRWLRQVTAGELRERFKGERLALAVERMTYNLASGFWRRFLAFEDPHETPFAHPYYWAAFTFAGA